MSNPASITVANIKYRVGDMFLLKLDHEDHELNSYPLMSIGLRVGINTLNQSVYSLEIIPNGYEAFTIQETDVEKGDLTDFHRILDQRINFLTKNPDLR